jgi:uncharacterized protein (TIGR03435 family)
LGTTAVAALLLTATCGLFAQSADPPKFAVASIKRDASTEPLSMAAPMGVGFRPGGRLVAHNAPVTMLIQRAYGLQSWQIVGGPDWISREGYDIEARPESTTDQKQMWLMLQTLLADRFKLTTHRETRELPVYDLVLAKGGPKLPAPESSPCSEVMTTVPEPGQPRPAAPCGLGVQASPSGLAMEAISTTMPALAKQLSMLFGREVVDKTGYTGRFSLHLDFAMDDALVGIPNPPRVATSDQPADGPPTITTALQDQLGLRIQSSKGPVEVLVIDRVEKPTAN